MAAEDDTRRKDRWIAGDSSLPIWIVAGLLFDGFLIFIMAILLWAAMGSDFDILGDATILTPILAPLV